ncbi:hypothetical protein PPERSA_02090 [Pseudocohnilembus persalinus]|uniref:Uncharacterized protein n=1 Tax=Pseudocohnilembus persalinus TaxID=266149 RepID=A0A0V0Q7V5_PSEPJ|nr:hypothetical protein PPERSA_02090 [Pseudocohnilembus persalinus]|eukprot:KRW98313.1 hypothetical protein PPERSA_02090 [Pseudocohnilembus persalinus]
MDSQNYIQNLVYTVGKELEKKEQDLDLIVQKFKNEWVNKKEDLEEILEDETSWSQFVQKAQIPFKLALKIKKTVQMKQTKQQSSNMHDKFIKKMLEQASLPQSEQIRKEILQQNSQNHQDQNEFVYIPTDIEELPFDSQEFQENPVIAKLFSFTNGQIKIFKAKGSSILVDSEEKKQKNSPRNCWTSVFIPLKSEEKIRDKFIRFDKTNIRYGKLLEVVDSLAGYSSYYYVYNSPEYAIVTASFDHIIFLDQIDPEEDLTINVYPSSIGTASIEIKIDMFQNNKLKITSLIVMVSVPTKQGKRKPFPHYDIENDPDHEILKKLQQNDCKYE